MPSQTRASRLGGAARRRSAAGGSGLAAVEVEAVRRHWSSLSVDDKIAVLHFQDRPLVEKLHAIQQMLRYSELMCYVCGVSTRDAVRKNVPYGLDSFEFECQGVSGGGMGLHGFKATRKFAESEDMIDHIEQQLGGFLAEGSRTSLWQTPSDWVQLFDPSPNSWTEFLSQVLRLVELGLFRAYRLAESRGDGICDPKISQTSKALPLLSLTSATACELEASEAPAVSAGSRSSKRKARKRRIESKQPGREEEEEEEEEEETIVRAVDVAPADGAEQDSVAEIDENDAVAEVVSLPKVTDAEDGASRMDECAENPVHVPECQPSAEDADSWQVVSRRRGRVANSSTVAAESETLQAFHGHQPTKPPVPMEMLRGRDKQATPPLSGSRASSVTATTTDDVAWAPPSPSLQSSLSDSAVAKTKDETGPATSATQSSMSAASSDTAGSSEELRPLDEISRSRAHTSVKGDDSPCLLRPVSSLHAVQEIVVPNSDMWQPWRPRSTDVVVRAPHEHSPIAWSAWINNGGVGADSAWQLVMLEPSAPTADSDIAESPLPVQVNETDLRVEVRRTFLHINLHRTMNGKVRDRARSAGP